VSFRLFLVQFAIGVAASVAAVAVIETLKQREQRKLSAPPVAPGYGTV